MTRFTLIASSMACAILTTGLMAQETGGIDVTGIPSGRGVYLRNAGGWVALNSTVMMPFWRGRDVALDILNVGTDHTTSEIPGSHSGVQIPDTRPTLYLHDIGVAELYLVHLASKSDYREVRQRVSRHFGEWAHFRPEEVAEIEVVGINGDVIAIRPSSGLKAGEYAVTVGGQPGYEWLRMGFDFGIVGQ